MPVDYLGNRFRKESAYNMELLVRDLIELCQQLNTRNQEIQEKLDEYENRITDLEPP